jgi:hypothetical protein
MPILNTKRRNDDIDRLPNRDPLLSQRPKVVRTLNRLPAANESPQ